MSFGRCPFNIPGREENNANLKQVNAATIARPCIHAHKQVKFDEKFLMPSQF